MHKPRDVAAGSLIVRLTLAARVSATKTLAARTSAGKPCSLACEPRARFPRGVHPRGVALARGRLAPARTARPEGGVRAVAAPSARGGAEVRDPIRQGQGRAPPAGSKIRHRLNGYLAHRVPSLILASMFRSCFQV